MWIYLQCGARSRVVHDRVRGYTYNFHPAGVVHLYPLAPNPAGDQPTFSEAPVNETNDYGTILLPVWGASSRRRSPGAVKISRMESPWILRSGAIGSCPLPLTLKHYPPAVMVPRIASSGWAPLMKDKWCARLT